MYITDEEYKEYQALKNGIDVRFNFYNLWLPESYSFHCNIPMSEDFKNSISKEILKNVDGIRLNYMNILENSKTEFLKEKRKISSNASEEIKNKIDKFSKLSWFKRLFFKPEYI